MLDIRFRRLVVVVGNSGIDAGVLTTLMQRVQYQTNVKAKLHLGTDHYLSPGGEGGRGWRIWG